MSIFILSEYNNNNSNNKNKNNSTKVSSDVVVISALRFNTDHLEEWQVDGNKIIFHWQTDHNKEEIKRSNDLFSYTLILVNDLSNKMGPSRIS